MKKLIQLLRSLALTVVMTTAFVPTTTAQESSNSRLLQGRHSPFTRKDFPRREEMNGRAARSAFEVRNHVLRIPMATTRSGVAPISVSRSPYQISELPGVNPAVAGPDSAFFIRVQEADRILNNRQHFDYDGLGRLRMVKQFDAFGMPLFVDADNNPIGSIGSYQWTDSNRTVTDYLSDGSYQTTYYTGNSSNPYSRDVEAYDAAGRETFYEHWNWDGEKLVCQGRYIHQYDALGNTLLSEEYKQVKGVLVGQFKYSATYDANGNCTSDTEYRWNSTTQTFDNDEQWVYTFDTAGYPALYTKGVWDGSQWQLTKRAIFSAIPGSQTPAVTAQMEEYTDDEWQAWGSIIITYLNSPQTPLISEYPMDRQVYTYDSENRETSYKYYYRKGEDWVLDEESETHYDSAGRIVDSQSIYSGQGSRVQSTYTAAGYIQEKIRSRWNGTGWIPSNRYTYTYDSSDRCTSYLSDYWDDEQGSFAGYEKKARTYDAAGCILTEVFFMEMSSGQFLEIGTYRYFYSGATSIDNAFDTTAVRVYTTSGAIVVEGVDDCTIYTLAGTPVSRSRSVSGATQQAASLHGDGSIGNRITVFVPSGAYVVRTTKGAVRVVVP